MNFTNIKLILAREVRDQLRDRRTLFMIAVLPLLLYPLLGMSFFQISQFVRQRATSVLVVGAENLPKQPPLIENGRFAKGLFPGKNGEKLLELHFPSDEPGPDGKTPEQPAAARQAVQSGEYDAALYFPESFDEELETSRQALRQEQSEGKVDLPQPQIFYTTASEKSQIAFARLNEVLSQWREQVLQSQLKASGLSPSVAKPFSVQPADVADQTAYRGAALWAKLLPVLLLLWALTGAFYPAVDLCAGEKERGTLETLLSSPAERTEIVLGKLLTIMAFSMITAVLNLMAIGLTAWLVLARMENFALPPLLSVVWLGLALVPISALFSALCLALAAFARSTKEGQYYLVPVLLVTMPLAILPMAPGVELNLGNSLVPVTGLVLLLRSLLEGNYWLAAQYSPVVVAVTLAACLLAIRWAVDQFNSESVLFREGERLDMWLWLRHLRRDRQPTPTVAAAVFCGVLILVVRFFMGFAVQPTADFAGFARVTAMTQLVVIAMPALLMTLLFTSSPRRALRLHMPGILTIPAAMLLAVLLHPTVGALQGVVMELYPLSDEVREALQATQELFLAAPLWQVVLLIAVTPAICEELAFRGFILTGLQRMGNKWRAIIYSAIFFGLAHAILQQSLIASLVGVVIGFLAVQTGSLWPGVAYHLVHNSMPLLLVQLTPETLERWPVLGSLLVLKDGGYEFHRPVVILSALAAALLLGWFGTRRPRT